MRRDIFDGWTYLDEQRYAEAVPVFERAIHRARGTEVEGASMMSDAHSGIAIALVVEGRVDEGLENANRAVTLSKHTANRTRLGRSSIRTTSRRTSSTPVACPTPRR